MLCDLYVIIERGERPDIPGARMVVAMSSQETRLRRYLNLVRVVRSIRDQGCSRFFVRISRGAGLVLSLFARRLGIEVYYWNSGEAGLSWPTWKEPLRRLRVEVDDLPTRLLMRLADRLVTGPDSMAAYYRSHYGIPREKILIASNDVDLRVYGPREERNDVRRALGMQQVKGCHVLFVGRVSHLKGGDRLPFLARALATEHRAKLHVVGAMHLEDVGKELAEQPNVVWHGAVPSRDVLSVYQASDVFILPSRSEGFPRVALEAMACGLPIVAFDVGGLREILGPRQQGMLVPRGDNEEFARRMRALIADPEARRELGEENLATVKRFSTERVAREFVERVVG